MLDVGTLGGSIAVPGSLSAPGGVVLNNAGQVVGTSNRAGDGTHHAFLWDTGLLMDLGTLGGSNSEARSVNDAGEVVGSADVSRNQPEPPRLSMASCDRSQVFLPFADNYFSVLF